VTAVFLAIFLLTGTASAAPLERARRAPTRPHTPARDREDRENPKTARKNQPVELLHAFLH